jgi:AcrR family transcriptional regulator
MAARDATAPDRGRSGRDRILEAAYGLFSRSGVRAIGVDTITAHADVAKMTLYRNFASKNDLAMAFMELREERWTKGWLQAEVLSRAVTPAGQLLAIFDLFSEWFAREDFEGCAFMTSLLEFEDPERFAAQWHILMKGAIVAAHEGDRDAALEAQQLGMLLLERHGAADPV